MAGITIHEFDALVAMSPGTLATDELRIVPPRVFSWLESQALRTAEAGDSAWLRLKQRRGRRAVQVTSFVGVIRAPDGFQIEVLPKVGKAIGGGDVQARQLLIEMLRCLGRFRHIQTDSAKLVAVHMPLLEVFIGEFLRTVEHIVKRGLRGDYTSRQDNVFALRGKIQIAAHLRQNLCRQDRFFSEFDEFSNNRPENRLLHSALRQALSWTASQAHQQLARELCFVFADVPESEQPSQDFQRVRLDRGMGHYADALAWARLILQDESPLTGAGVHRAPSLLFPMEAVFEAFVAKHFARQLAEHLTLRTQASSFSLVKHQNQDWFRLKPDLLVQESAVNRLVLDAKWKLIDGSKANNAEKYGLSQADFYQLHAYGQAYLDGQGDVVLIYPKTDAFDRALPVFEFPRSHGLRLWVLPFCLQRRCLVFPACGGLDALIALRHVNAD
ncbi:2-keto-D-gluconate dehydrogenase [Burkholderia glumae]|uniref:McrC family protein n=1 Tax=Burkholderia glumae TaxID=337 RepID=UPI001373A9F6|nr:McrC family protein [Burkholderia glumae]MCR1770930.1 McrC family protein [Burkholderia glumae]QHP91596.1 2-keto-D-gluconate dehydrogenase [Burkholderia glumae]